MDTASVGQVAEAVGSELARLRAARTLPYPRIACAENNLVAHLACKGTGHAQSMEFRIYNACL
jgi:hypothetical protein